MGLKFKKKEGVNLDELIRIHLKEMGALVTQMEMDRPNVDKALSYHMAVQHFENMMIPFLDDMYYEKKEQFSKELPLKRKDLIHDEIEYFRRLSKMTKLLIAYAYNNRILKVDQRIRPIQESLFD